MQTITTSRVTGSVCLAIIIFGGMVQCDACPDPQPNAAPEPDDPGPGTTAPTAICGDEIRFRAPVSLHAPEECDGTDTAGNPVMFPPGGELAARPPTLRRCPYGRAFAANEQFHIYWTICNTSDRRPATRLPYELTVPAPGSTTPLRALNFTQPDLERCQCHTEIAIFNSPDPDPNRQLAPGSYVLRLTGNYAPGAFSPVNFEQIVINP